MKFFFFFKYESMINVQIAHMAVKVQKACEELKKNYTNTKCNCLSCLGDLKNDLFQVIIRYRCYPFPF